MRRVALQKFTDVSEVLSLLLLSLGRLMMEAVRTSEMSVNLYKTAQRNFPEVSHLQNVG
jgi:hypothetical protein